MIERALVLGGGGPVGVAWEIGVVAGLAAEGVSLGDADFILGTSAGSIVGAQLANRFEPEAMAASQRELANAPPPSETDASAPDISPLLRFIARFPPDREPDASLRAEVGQFALSAVTPAEADFIAYINGALRGAEWSDRFACSAVDAANGAFRLWRQADHAMLSAAVASSCAVPGVYPPISIAGRRWIDGGMRSMSNIDCAPPCRRLLALVVMPPQGSAFMRPRIDREVQAAASAGAQVELIVPDQPSGAAFGFNLMDGSRRGAVLEAGLAQGRREAARWKAFWS